MDCGALDVTTEVTVRIVAAVVTCSGTVVVTTGVLADITEGYMGNMFMRIKQWVTMTLVALWIDT